MPPEFNRKRTELANAFAAAGAELMDHLAQDAALAAIPYTSPQQYVVAGTPEGIARVLPADAPTIQAQAAPIGYARESELAKLADNRVAGVGMMIHKEPGEGKVAIYLTAATISAALSHAAATRPELPASQQTQVDAMMQAIQHACGSLPVGYEVILEMENGAGGVVWTDDEGERHVIDGEGYLSQDIYEAIEKAQTHAAQQSAQGEKGGDE